tara:strand:- start:4793 stop:5590 length:798 start_codon:yes stop_codon:yes gene_type:complete
MKVLILGGNRFVGKALAEKLISNGSEVTVFNRKGSGPKYTHIIQGNRNETNDLNKIDFELYDYIVDMCLFKPEQFDLFKPFLEKCNPKKYIFISSAAVGIEAFGNYATEKEEVEKLLRSTSIKYEIIKPVYIVGDNSHRPRLGYYINQIQKSLPISVSGKGNQPINLIYVDDVVNLIFDRLFKEVTYDTYTISNGEPLTQIDLINQIKIFLESNKGEIILNKDDSPFLDEKFIFDKYPLETLPLSKMLPKYIKWFKTNKKDKYGY